MAELIGGNRAIAQPAPGLGLPPAVSLAWFIARPTDVFDWARRRHPDAFSLQLPGLGNVNFVSAPDLLREIFTLDEASLRAGEGNGFLKPIVGTTSLLTLDGVPHRRHRKLMNPALHGERLASFATVVREVAERDLAGWPRGEVLPTRSRFQTMTLEIILRAVFGIEDPRDRAPWLTRLGALAELANHWILLVPRAQIDLGPRSPWGRIRKVLADADRAILEEIRRRRALGGQSSDVLGLLLEARDEEGEGLDDAEIRDELVTMLLAGHETTATSLAWALDLLLRSPAALERARAEARESPAYERAAFRSGGLPYLDAVTRETLRLRPVLGNVNRRVQRPLTVGSVSVQPGQFLSPCIWNTHRREDLYPEPERFRPERFLERTFNAFEWLPFGGGSRRCMGMAFAMAETKAILAAVLATTDLRPARDRPERVARRGITLAPARGGEVVVS